MSGPAEALPFITGLLIKSLSAFRGRARGKGAGFGVGVLSSLPFFSIITPNPLSIHCSRPAARFLSLSSSPADATLTAGDKQVLLVGPVHVHGTARLEDGRPSVDLDVRGAWRVEKEDGAGGAAALCGSYAVPRIVSDPEFAGELGPLSVELTDDGEHLQVGARAALVAELAARVKAAVHTGLAEAAGGGGGAKGGAAAAAAQ